MVLPRPPNIFWSTLWLKGRNWGSVHIEPRELCDVYAEPFSAVIGDANIATVMNSYAAVDGLPCAGSKAILTDPLRTELGFSDAVVADYFSIEQLLHFHHVDATPGDLHAWYLWLTSIWSYRPNNSIITLEATHTTQPVTIAVEVRNSGTCVGDEVV